jgi:peptide/nickel transport system substrate-binding protein
LRITRSSALVAVAASSALVLAGCAEGDAGGDDNAGLNTGTAVNIMWNQPFYSYNGTSITGNATANNNVLYLMNSGFNYYDEDLNLARDESFGSYEIVSEDPLQIEYTFAETAQWSDGVQVGPADLLLEWAAQSGRFNNVEPEYDEDFNIVNQDEIDAGIYFDAASPAVALIEETPEIDGNSITLTYSKPFADWETAIGVNLPAHVVAQRALDIEDPQEATDALVEAITSEDSGALADISQVWSNDFNYTSLPEDESLRLSNGAYLMTEFVEDQFLTLTANTDYQGERQASIETITIRYNGDPMGTVQALQNGEVDLISPQATADVLAALENLDGIEVETGEEGTFEHVDLQFGNGGPFDPSTYDGDEETARLVRQAFLKTIPREEILETLIRPLNPGAEIRNSYTVVPGSPMYDAVTEANEMESKLAFDTAEAASLLEEAGVDTPVQVRLLFDPNNPRRQNQYELISAAASEAGFDVVPYDVQEGWGFDLSNATSFYDAALFGWQSTSTAVTESDANYRTDATNNFYGYSNAEVDALFDELQVTTDESRQEEILSEIEAILVDDAFGTTIFQFPGVTAWNPERINNVSKLTIAPTIFYGFWNWEPGEASTENGETEEG